MAEAAGETSSRIDLRTRRFRFDLFFVVTWVASAATVITLVWIVLSILQAAFPAMAATGLNFFVNMVWNPSRNIYGAFPFLAGTTISSGIALIFALPLGDAIAIFLSEDFLPMAIRQVVRFVV